MPTLHMIILHIFMYIILLFIALDTMRLFFNHYKNKRHESEQETNIDI